MNKGLALLTVAVGVAAIGGIAYAAEHEDSPLPPPRKRVCNTAEDVGSATSALLADNTISPKGYRAAADVLRNDTVYCDAAAKQAGDAAIVVLEAKAKQLESGQGPAPSPAGTIPVPWFPGQYTPLLIPWPGYVGHQQTTGLHNEPGELYWYSNGDEWFVPNDQSLAPYFVPGGSNELPHPTTQGGSCCAACERGEECEGCE